MEDPPLQEYKVIHGESHCHRVILAYYPLPPSILTKTSYLQDQDNDLFGTARQGLAGVIPSRQQPWDAAADRRRGRSARALKKLVFLRSPAATRQGPVGALPPGESCRDPRGDPPTLIGCGVSTPRRMLGPARAERGLPAPEEQSPTPEHSYPRKDLWVVVAR